MPAPTAPSGLVATVYTTTSARLVWTNNDVTLPNGETYSYDYDLHSDNFATPTSVTGVSGASSQIIVTGLTIGQTYDFRLKIHDATTGDSSFSNTATLAMPMTQAPATLMGGGAIGGNAIGGGGLTVVGSSE